MIISIIALILSIMAFQRTGGRDELKRQMESLSKATESLREKTADLLDKMEAALRAKGTEEKEEKKEKPS
ncbi:MAG: hypothetical protein DRG36_01080 [Deltaproteobacteria bacterium]|nr:MAG: hypothetical protein DRG36_01080 [Deltaproteobacteria bacterium]